VGTVDVSNKTAKEIADEKKEQEEIKVGIISFLRVLNPRTGIWIQRPIP
jgi:hypothetical protein